MNRINKLSELVYSPQGCNVIFFEVFSGVVSGRFENYDAKIAVNAAAVLIAVVKIVTLVKAKKNATANK